MSECYIALEALDVDIETIPVHPIKVDHMHDVLVTKVNHLLWSYFLPLEEHNNFLGLDP